MIRKITFSSSCLENYDLLNSSLGEVRKSGFGSFVTNFIGLSDRLFVCLFVFCEIKSLCRACKLLNVMSFLLSSVLILNFVFFPLLASFM